MDGKSCYLLSGLSGCTLYIIGVESKSYMTMVPSLPNQLYKNSNFVEKILSWAHMWNNKYSVHQAYDILWCTWTEWLSKLEQATQVIM